LHSKANAHATRPNFERCKFSLPKFFGTPCISNCYGETGFSIDI
jgi:hypothetical protein